MLSRSEAIRAIRLSTICRRDPVNVRLNPRITVELWETPTFAWSTPPRSLI